MKRLLPIGLLLAACSGTPPAVDAGNPSAERAACSYRRGAPASTTLNQLPTTIPIDHLVFVMQENRSFDHYFSSLTRRDANAEPPFEMFDFSHADLSVPSLPAAMIDDAGVTDCAAQFPPK